MNNYKKELNESQLLAVTLENKNSLILAGAGSGKTRVLSYRICWLISNEYSGLNEIFAVTFTNKAANEMKNRINKMLTNMNIQPDGFGQMWIGTFHGLAHKMLRLNHNEIGIQENFQIIDKEDQDKILKNIHKSLNIDEETISYKDSKRYIDWCKENAIRSNQARDSMNNIRKRKMCDIYTAYEKHCKENGLLDFSELLLLSYELLSNNSNVRDKYRRIFKYVLVDEFQDTNTIQYNFLELLTDGGKATNIMVVGDDDQSIYSWRGAKASNTRKFKDDFHNVTVVKLEQNYRSTKHILNLANCIIERNQNRIGKKLWTDSSNGDLPTMYVSINEYDEVKFLSNTIKEAITEKKLKYNDFAVLYRANVQSRVVEEEMIKQNIPYKIYGGLKFYERAEIKNLIAYVRLIYNKKDDLALERIINIPTRGIGETTVSNIKKIANEGEISIYHCIRDIVMHEELYSMFTTRTKKSLSMFLDIIDSIERESNGKSVSDILKTIVDKTQLKEFYSKENNVEEFRIENINELIDSSETFGNDIHEFLSSVVIGTDIDSESGEKENKVNLMTLHSAKGLEFNTVFIIGMEDQLFPHHMSINSTEELEEERRLFYVGITRAMRKLYMTYAEIRGKNNIYGYREPSRFLEEIPYRMINRIYNSKY